MSDNFIRLPLNLRTDPNWMNFSARERHAFEELYHRASYKDFEEDDHGVMIQVKRGQFLTTVREFAEFCNSSKPNWMEDFDRNFVHRFFEKMKRCHFSGQEVRHIKTLVTLTYDGFYKKIETGFETNLRQDRDKIPSAYMYIDNIDNKNNTPPNPQKGEVCVDFSNDPVFQELFSSFEKIYKGKISPEVISIELTLLFQEFPKDSILIGYKCVREGGNPPKMLFKILRNKINQLIQGNLCQKKS